MKTVNSEAWAPPKVIAQAFKGHIGTICRWGREGKFGEDGYKQDGPGGMVIHVLRAVKYYSMRFPKAVIDFDVLAPYIDLEELAPYMQPTA